MPIGVARMARVPEKAFVRRWAGLAIAVQEYHFGGAKGAPYYQYIQRSGERRGQYDFKSFLGTAQRSEVDDLTLNFPKRWHIEEFFNADQALGWKRAGTLNLHIRYGQMSTALLAQAAIQQFRDRLGTPYAAWDAKHLASSILQGLNGDIRVEHDTIVVTFYNAPNVDDLRKHYENLPAKLALEGVDPRVPWLYNFKLDFRFR